MKINKNSLNCLSKQQVSDSAKMLWLLLSFEQKDDDGFVYLPQSEWSERLNISTRQLRRYLKDLSEHFLIERIYRNNYVSGQNGIELFVRTVKPETDNDTTFFAIFTGFSGIKKNNSEEVKTVHLEDVYSCNNVINFKTLNVNLRSNCEIPQNIHLNHPITFNASVEKNEGRFVISNLRNIKPRILYYDN